MEEYKYVKLYPSDGTVWLAKIPQLVYQVMLNTEGYLGLFRVTFEQNEVRVYLILSENLMMQCDDENFVGLYQLEVLPADETANLELADYIVGSLTFTWKEVVPGEYKENNFKLYNCNILYPSP